MREQVLPPLVIRLAATGLLWCSPVLAAPQTTVLETQRLAPATSDYPGLHVLDVHENLMLTNEGVIWRRGSDGHWVFEEQLEPTTELGVSTYGTYYSGVLSDDLACLGVRFAQNLDQESTGAALVFRKQSEGVWLEEAALYADDGQPEDEFGAAAELAGNHLFIGAPYADLDEPDQGAVYLFEYSNSSWQEVDKLIRPNGDSEDNFGASIASDGDTVVVGMGRLFQGEFGVTLYRPLGSGWQQSANILGEPVTYNSRFGFSVDIHGDHLVVGALYGDSGLGSAHVFQRNSGIWNEVATLGHPNPKPNDWFGHSVAIQEDRIAVGCPFDDYAMTQHPGSAHLYQLVDGAWGYDRRVLGEPGPNANFGYSVHLSGRQALIGTPGEQSSEENPGVIYNLSLFPSALETYCESTQNSTSELANLWLEGSTSVAANDLLMRAGPVPNQSGLLFYGPGQAQVPFGNGIRCVDGMLFRLAPVVAAANVLTFKVDLLSPPTAAGLITPGSTWNFQSWYRDPLAGGSSFNLSAAIALTFEP